MKMKDLCRDDRPREKLLDKGARTLSSAELLAILLRTGTGKMNVVEVARELLKSAGSSLHAVSTMSLERLCEISGIGPDKAATVSAAFELGRRSEAERVASDRMTISSPKDVFRLMLPDMRGLEHEEFWIVFLNRANNVIGKERMSVGGLESTTVDTKAVLRRALDRKASGVIMVHNHPSGSALPGRADITQTDLIRKALRVCDIQLLDHVVVADGGWYSFADETLVDEKF
ncbi:MAG: DNA repair protein RadC [Bacteroidales bacterium]|nr:DNA repair protein RadC [Bacteroidales bacterium]